MTSDNTILIALILAGVSVSVFSMANNALAHSAASDSCFSLLTDGPYGAKETINMRKLKPGQIAPRSGEYAIVGPRGGTGKERTVVKGEPLPPTPAAGSSYKLVRPAKNRAGRGK